ncbi:MAG: hypothetical protein ACRCXZ_01045, partial [Patescibacteria group bacterium]
MKNNQFTKNDLSFKSIEDLVSHVQSEPISKFNFSNSGKKIQKNYLIPVVTLLTSAFILLLVFFVPTITGKAEILPISNTPTNEKLILTSKSTPFFAKFGNKTFYSIKKDNFWTIDLSEFEGESTFEVGNFLDLGFTKINSLNTQQFKADRVYKIANNELYIKKYISSKKDQFSLKLDSKYTYLKLTTNDKVIYETGNTNNTCTLSKTDNLLLSCPYSVDFKEVEIMNKLKLYDQYGNTKDFDE